MKGSLFSESFPLAVWGKRAVSGHHAVYSRYSMPEVGATACGWGKSGGNESWAIFKDRLELFRQGMAFQIHVGAWGGRLCVGNWKVGQSGWTEYRVRGEGSGHKESWKLNKEEKLSDVMLRVSPGWIGQLGNGRMLKDGEMAREMPEKDYPSSVWRMNRKGIRPEARRPVVWVGD